MRCIPAGASTPVFHMDRTEVTAGQFKKFLQESEYSYEGIGMQSANSSSQVNIQWFSWIWYDATAYAKWGEKDCQQRTRVGICDSGRIITLILNFLKTARVVIRPYHIKWFGRQQVEKNSVRSNKFMKIGLTISKLIATRDSFTSIQAYMICCQ